MTQSKSGNGRVPSRTACLPLSSTPTPLGEVHMQDEAFPGHPQLCELRKSGKLVTIAPETGNPAITRESHLTYLFFPRFFA